MLINRREQGLPKYKEHISRKQMFKIIVIVLFIKMNIGPILLI